MTLKNTILLLIFIVAVLAQMGSLQVTPNSPTLFTNTTYLVSYYTLYNLPASATFFLDFSSTYIGVPNATLNISATTINSATATPATGSCTSSKCTLRLNNNAAANSNIQFNIGNLLNPPFLLAQTTNLKVTFNSTYSQSSSWIINSILYSPLPMGINAMKQSDYGVGNTDVTYSFNLTVPLTPANPQLSITIPSQVGIGNLQTALSFYGSIQNAIPVYISNLIIFSVVTAASNSTNSTGYIYLTISGLTNPKSMGNSTSFIIQLLTTTFPGTTTSCTNCIVAQVNTQLIAESTVPGNIATINFLSSNTLIGQSNTITIYSQLYASIPAGGMYQIVLPSTVSPVLPVNCSTVYGFTLTSGSTSPSCSYNAATNSISTNNFVFSSIGSVVIKVSINNPPDTGTAPFWFRTFDANNNMIGNSTNPYLFKATPLTLNTSLQKNSSQVDSTYKLTVNLTLQITLQSSDIIKVILPQANYLLSSIVCSSAGITLTCSSAIDNSTGNLTISMSPPCSQCTSGSSLSFTIDGLINPSFVSSYSQAIVVQTAHITGVVESSTTTIALTPSILTISNYTRTGSSAVGSSYSMSFNYTTSPYITTNGGQLVINFNQYDSYINIIYNSNSQTYDYPSSLTVTDSSGNTYSNTLAYYNSATPNSIQQIVIRICGTSSCNGNIIVQGLRKSFSPVSSLTQNVQTTTIDNDLIATSTFSTSQFNTAKTSKTLSLNLSNSVTTLNSNYALSFTSVNLPFQPTLSLSIPQGSINGGCFATHNSTIFLGVFNCQVVNSSSISLTYSGDNTPMMIDTILYSITITNVANPLTIAPLPYSIITQFNNLPSQQFSIIYSIQSALPLTFTYSLTNNTLGQSSKLTISITSTHPSFDEIVLNIPVGLMTISTGAYQSSIVNNNYQINQIYSLTNASVQLNIINPTSTSISGNITFSMLSAGYLSASGTIMIAPVTPVYLGLTTALSSRVVGGTSQLTITFNRVNPYTSESSFFFNMTSALFDFTTALYNNSALILPISVPIGITTISITNLKNLLFVPNTPPPNSIWAWTMDNSGFKVALSVYSSASLIPNQPATGLSYGFTRTNTAINGLGSLYINYTPSFPSIAGVMTISMPANQTSIVTPACTMIGASNNAVNCVVLSSTTNSISIYYLNQSTTTLSNVLNLEPNSNLLQVNLLTSVNQLIQSTSAQITPSIQYNQLNITGTSSSLTVATNTNLLFNLSATNPIDIGSKIVIMIPTKTFTKIQALASQTCTYVISGTSYNSCQYATINGSWVTQVNLTYLGPSVITANTAISINLTLTNAWTSTVFSTSLIVFYVNSPTDNFVAQGVLSLINLYGGQGSLAVASINSLTVGQSSSVAATANSLNFTFSLAVPIAQTTILTLSIPKSAYSMNLSSIVSNLVVYSQSQNTSYYVIYLLLACSQTFPLCNLPNYQYTITLNVLNNAYVQNQQDPTILQIFLNGQIVSAVSYVTVPLYSAQTIPSPTISRTNSNAYQPTNVTIGLTIPTLNSTSLSVVIWPLVTASGNLPLINSLTYVGLSATQSLTYTLNTSNHITIALSGQTGAINLLLTGSNNLLVSIAPQIYTLTIVDSNYVYYSCLLSPQNKIIPYKSGLTLQRITTTVGSSTNIYLNGNLPSSLPLMSVLFNGYNVAISGQSFNTSLGNIVNSNNVSDTTPVPIIIKNSDYIAYSNSLQYTPSLTPQTLTSFISLQMPSTISINQNVSAYVSLSNNNLNYLSIVFPSFFQTVNFCCIDSSCSQTYILNCSFSTTTSNSLVEIYLNSNQVVSNVTLGLTALNYQALFPNSSVTITTALPSASIKLNFNISVLALTLTSSLFLSNWQVNTNNNYTLTLKTIPKVGYLNIIPPSFITTQLTATSSSSTSTLTINGAVSNFPISNNNGQPSILIPMNGSTSNITLVINSIMNPINNQPFSFIIQQAQEQSFTYNYGYNNISFAMKVFDAITVFSALRNVTKVGIATSVTLNITTPTYSDQMIITFPSTQLYATSACSILNSNNNSLPCSVISNNSILTTSVPGNSNLVITGLINQVAFDLATANDLVTVTIGNPYTRASTTPNSTTFLSPQLTMGTITLNSFSSSNLVCLRPTTLTLNISLQNYQNINGFILQFSDPYYYILSTNVTCQINNVAMACSSLSANQLFVQAATTPSSQQLTLSISNILNYVRPTNWAIMSVKTQNINGIIKYSNVDLYNSKTVGLSPITPLQLAYRIILPNNYVQSTPTTLTLIIDSTISNQIPNNLLFLNFTAQGILCSSSAVAYASTLSIPCTLNDTLNVQFSVQLYHINFPTTNLATGNSKMFIYPSPSSNCANQMCDSCSSSNGQQYCFVCRQGLYSSNGQCQSSCNSGSFPYSSTNICQPCSPTCSNCFGLYFNQCLSCNDSSLVLNSGTCQNSCPTGSFSYNSNCVSNIQCDGVNGCRTCSSSGFCYDCLPNYNGAPTCQYSNVMPPTIMIYILAPFILVGLIPLLIVAFRCLGAESLLSQSLFSFSLIQLFAWALTIPIMSDISTAMVLVSLLILRIIISIVSYEVFYKKNLGQLSQKLLQEQSQKQAESKDKNEQADKTTLNNWKTKLVRFMAHFNGPDSYELLQSRISQPVLSVTHSLPIQVIFMLNRLIVSVLMFYMLSIATIGDSVFMPAIIIATAGILMFCRLLTWDKVRGCLQKCRT